MTMMIIIRQGQEVQLLKRTAQLLNQLPPLEEELIIINA